MDEVGAAREVGIKSFILFGIPEYKDATGSSALKDEGIVQQLASHDGQIHSACLKYFLDTFRLSSGATAIGVRLGYLIA